MQLNSQAAVDQNATVARPRITYRWPSTLDSSLAAGVIDLYNDSIRTEDVLGYRHSLDPDAARAVIERLAESMSRGEKHFFGICAAERLIGMALLTPSQLPNCRHVVEWSKGVIHSEFRGRGVLGPALVALAHHCRTLGWDIVTLDVRAESRSHKIWSLAGFKEYGRLPDYARIDGVTKAGAYMYAEVGRLLAESVHMPQGENRVGTT